MTAPDKVDEIRALFALVIGTMTALWGWLGWAIVLWVICIVLDYASGTAAAKKAGDWSSDAAREGLWHKLGEIFAVLVAALCDLALEVLVNGSGIDLPIEVGAIVTPVVLLWYIITELGSIAENAGKLGAPVPKWLQKSLRDYKDKLDKAQDVSTSTYDEIAAMLDQQHRPQHLAPDPDDEPPDSAAPDSEVSDMD